MSEPAPPPARVHGPLKLPPHSIEAEQSVLGGLMLNNDAWFNVAEVVSADDFYRPSHQIIFEAMTEFGRANTQKTEGRNRAAHGRGVKAV